MSVPKHIEDKLLVRWHQTFGHRRAEFAEDQKAMRFTLQRRGLLGFDLTPIAESVRKLLWR